MTLIVKNAKFIASNTNVGKCPADGKPEYAFIGRSNVGKSSLINALTLQKGLAKTSSTPGKTVCINHFLVNDSWYIVDLPGYGYAKCSKEGREKIRKVIEGYILQREEMTLLFVLIDCRHTPQKVDMEFMEWLGENGIPFAIIFTKADKLGKEKLAGNIKNYKKELLKSWEELPPIYVTSSEDNRGREELLDYISEINKSLDNNI
ncbi:MAG: YihA family ribosome biogenesis GTP-binding protein [Bacteroidales bacterium]|nr:YihA family ribosome biogenesis GTP-binding protein [Bacteroidales bacterium]MBQ7818278.1 YihA family ribosome biogenesis GTP-binding protein [Bacteroidales bacterium]